MDECIDSNGWDSLDYQLGSVIKQEGRPMAYYSRKLIAAEKNYTTIEKECLAIVEILKCFQMVLLGSCFYSLH